MDPDTPSLISWVVGLNQRCHADQQPRDCQKNVEQFNVAHDILLCLSSAGLPPLRPILYAPFGAFGQVGYALNSALFNEYYLFIGGRFGDGSS